MKFLSLEWFKSKIEIATEKVIEKVVSSKLEQLMEQETAPSCFKIRNIKLVNNVLTVVLEDGEIFTKSEATEEDYERLTKASSKEEVINIISNIEVVIEKEKEEKKKQKAIALSKGIDLLKNNPDFIIKDEFVELAGTGRTMPQLLVEKFIEVVNRVGDKNLNEDEEYVSLKRFFMWCALNPRAEVANELYRFLTENSFKITKQGFFVALRNVVTVNTDNEIVTFVSNAYNKVKAVWKKNPDNYRVVKYKNEYKLELTTNTDVKGEIVGNLTTLYLDLPNMSQNRFTDHWTKTFDIRVGRVVNMPMEDCNWTTQDCMASGLHFTANQIHYVGCGDTSVLILINPMKVVGIGQHKGRCYEYLPIMTVPREEATKILHDDKFDTLQLDEEYAIRELENLAEKAKEGFTIESKKHQFNLPQISSENISKIVSSLSEMKEQIKDRVVNLD